MIMVDELRSWPGQAAPRVFGAGRDSCHLTTDGSLDDLHAFAGKLGMKRVWFQDHPRHPHYDLTPRRRAFALRLGALFVPSRDQARARLKRVSDAQPPL